MTKRFLAYLIDIIFVLFIIALFSYLIPHISVDNLNHNLNEYTESLLNHSISLKEYITSYAYLNYMIDKANIIYSVINILLVIIYFIVVPLMFSGQTIGLKIFKLKLIGELKLKNLFIRNIITTGLLFMIINVVLIHILNFKWYFIIMSVLCFIQISLVILSIFMILYRKDHYGLQDKYSKTYIKGSDIDA